MNTLSRNALLGSSVLGVLTLLAAVPAFALSDADADRTVLTFSLAVAGVLKLHAASAFRCRRASGAWSYPLGTVFLATAAMYLPYGYGIVAVPVLLVAELALLAAFAITSGLIDVTVTGGLVKGLKSLPRIAAVQVLMPFLLVIPIVNLGALVGAARFWRETARTGAAPIGLVFGGLRKIPAGLQYLLPTLLLTAGALPVIGFAIATVEGREVMSMVAVTLLYVAVIPSAFLATRFAYYASILGEDEPPDEGVTARAGRLVNAHPVETGLAVTFGRLLVLPTLLGFEALLAKPLSIWLGWEGYRGTEQAKLFGGCAILLVWWFVLVPVANLVLAHVYVHTDPPKLPVATGTPLVGWLALFSMIGLLGGFAFTGQYSRDLDSGLMITGAAFLVLVVSLVADAYTWDMVVDGQEARA